MKTNEIMTLVRFRTEGYEDEDGIKEQIEQYLFVSEKDALKWLKHYLKERDDYFSKEQREQIIHDLKETGHYFYHSIELEQVTCITVE